ncbi:hypothetical protein BABINDRAFT_176068 [Babjeviella inositovora NRRL Y-12698]|uniref:Tethering factor for nuclear proteasome STS1 n=1 Tax=Babjeviella inositovora NRRL Y-12698 TaxID=984486 RepID=A0A1E3QSB0_9ASCO|nr:uncharacterized protein BABINDRAFT_176068 [Babjeviella inositovora NRRL Y-12698]ODQ79912.1 hypothetical protein BABINDRAFT_176068 [Babjeviella inositovora NRRL Y-12698]
MMSSGFSWGMKSTQPAALVPAQDSSTANWHKAMLTKSAPRPKRRYDDGESEHGSSRTHLPLVRRISQFKKSRTPYVRGQQLPIHRLIEVMSKEDLQSMVMQIIHKRPELAQEVVDIAPKPSVTNSLTILSNKLTGILNSLPYKVDPSSNYAFLRIKPSLDDFYEALSDYTLSYLPPVEVNHIVTLEFLEAITSFLHKLPNWSNPEFNYSKLLAYEQISNTWLMIIRSFVEKASTNLMFLLNENYEAKISKHSELSQGKFDPVLEYLRSEIISFNNETRISQNFSMSNSPLHGLSTNTYADRMI